MTGSHTGEVEKWEGSKVSFLRKERGPAEGGLQKSGDEMKKRKWRLNNGKH